MDNEPSSASPNAHHHHSTMSTLYDTDEELLAQHWKICALNDAFRSELSLVGPAIADKTLVITHGVAAQGNAFVDRALKAVREFAEFYESNDPYGEHDFGSSDTAAALVRDPMRSGTQMQSSTNPSSHASRSLPVVGGGRQPTIPLHPPGNKAVRLRRAVGNPDGSDFRSPIQRYCPQNDGWRRRCSWRLPAEMRDVVFRTVPRIILFWDTRIVSSPAATDAFLLSGDWPQYPSNRTCLGWKDYSPVGPGCVTQPGPEPVVR